MKFCCMKFQALWEVPSNANPNIRIAEFRSKWLIRKGKTYELKFFITQGYKGEFHLDDLNISIDFCPFCGTSLDEHYQKKEFANEIEGVTFDIVK